MKKYLMLLGLLLLPVVSFAVCPSGNLCDPPMNQIIIDKMIRRINIMSYFLAGSFLIFFISFLFFKKQRKIVWRFFRSFVVLLIALLFWVPVYDTIKERTRAYDILFADYPVKDISADFVVQLVIFILATGYLLYELVRLGIWGYKKLSHKSEKEIQK